MSDLDLIQKIGLGQNQSRTASSIPRKTSCPFFPQGRCRFGSSCRFVHEVAPLADGQSLPDNSGRRHGQNLEVTHPVDPQICQTSTATSSRPSPRPLTRSASTQHRGNQPLPDSPNRTHPRPKKGSNLCRSWQAGNCSKGDKCQFRHDPKWSEPPTVHQQRQRPPIAHATKTMQDRQKGAIKPQAEAEEQRKIELAQAEAARSEWERQQQQRRANQAAQKAKHEATRQAWLTEQAVRKTLQEARIVEMRKEEAARVVQHIVLGSIVTLGAGLDIRHIVTGFESCRIRVRNLPQDATVAEVHALFTQQGVQPVSFHLLEMRRTPDGKQEAIVLSDAVVGEAIAVGLDGVEFRQENLKLEVTENGGYGGMGRSSTTNSNILTISWWAPSVSYIAQYLDPTHAEAKVRELNGKMCGGRRVKSELNRPISVKIYGLAPNVTQTEVETFSGSFLLQRLNVKEYDVGQALVSLRLHMERNAEKPFTFEGPRIDAAQGSLTVQAHFDSWDEAKKVHDSLANQRFSFIANNTFRLRLPDPIQYKITIPTEQYQVQSKQWRSLIDGTNGEECSLRVHISEGRVMMRVVGRDKKLVGSLKVRVENLAAGEKLESWHRSLAGAGNSFLRSVFLETGAYVRNDWRLRVLKVYGDASVVKNAHTMINAEIERLASFEQTVLLKRQSIGFFVRHGLAALKEILGEDNATLNLSLSPCRIIIRGGEDARHALDKLIKESLNNVDITMTQDAENGSLCPVCYSEVSAPVQLACGHSYCTACIRHFLTTACDTKILPLLCLGSEPKCDVPIPISTIQKFLPPAQFNHLVEVAFEVHLEQHPQEFKFCTTPDCKQVYRCASSKPLVVHCPSCFSAVCSGCYEEAHDGMGCVERKLLNDPAEQERLNETWAARQGIKKCPGCGVWIEKTEGCNHMSCRCGKHICWVCMGTFTADTIYEHMGTAHGGIYGEPEDNEENNIGADHFHEQNDCRRRYHLALNARLDVARGFDEQMRREQEAVTEEVRRRRVREAVLACYAAEDVQRRRREYEAAAARREEETERWNAHWTTPHQPEQDTVTRGILGRCIIM